MIDVDRDNNSADSLELYADQEGEKHVQKILKSVENEPWGVTLLQLAWTAGPLTFIALQGGYLIGYGQLAPFDLFIYFAGYTALTGLIGFIIKAFYNAHHKTRSAQTKNNYLTCNDLIFRLIRTISDFRLSELSKAERKAASSSILLSNTHALPASIALGVNELTNNESLIEISQKIELFRRSGLYSRINDLIEKSDILQHEDTLQLINTPNDAGYYLRMRLQGIAPTLQEGLRREDGFLQRINQAYENHQPATIHLKDAEEFLILLYELLNGRKITFLSFNYTNHKKLKNTAKNLEKSRANFRLSRASLISKIDELYSKMINADLILDVKDYDPRLKCDHIFSSLNDFASDILIDLNSQSYETIKTKKEKFLNFINSYTKLIKQYNHTVYHQKLLNDAINNWQKLSSQFGEKKTRFRYGLGKKGLRINQKEILLDDEKKLNCTNAIVKLVKKYWADHVVPSSMDKNNIKELIIKLSCQLDQFINLTNPINQYGIESSNATNFGGLDLDSSIEARTLWSSSMVSETKHDLHLAAEKLAKVLLYEYDEMLDDNAMDFLEEKYGANRSNLNKLIDDKKNTACRPVHDIPVQLPPKPPSWDLIVKRIKKIS